MKRSFVCGGVIVFLALNSWGFWRGAPGRRPATPPPRAVVPLPVSGGANLGQGRLAPDRSPTHIVRAPHATAVVAEGIAVQGTLQLDAEASFTPAMVIVEISCTMPPDGRWVVANSGLAKPEPVEGQKKMYRFETVIKAPLRPGIYQIVGKYRGKVFSKGTLDVKTKTENGKTGRR